MMRAWTATLAIGVTFVLGACAPPDPPPNTSTTTSTIDEASCAIERRTIETALAAWRAETGAHPAQLDDLVGVYLAAPPVHGWTYTVDGDSFSLVGPC